MMKWNEVVENLENLVGEVIAADDFESEIILAFGDFEFDGETAVHISKYLEGKFNVFIESENAPNAQLKTEHDIENNTYTIISVISEY